MMQYLRQNTDSQEALLGPFLDDTDGKTVESGLTIANTNIQICKAGSTSFVSKNSGGGTYVSGGYYSIVLDATDSNTLGSGIVSCQMTGALPVKAYFCVLPPQVFDSLVAGSDLLQTDVQAWKDATAPANSGDAYARLGAPTGASIAADIQTRSTDASVWGYGTKTLTSFGTLASDTATAVWGATDRTLSNFGTLVATIWTYAARTLTSALNITTDDAKIDNSKIARLDANISTRSTLATSDLSGIESAIGTLDSAVDSLTSTVGGIGTTVGSTATTVGTISTAVGTISTAVSGLDTQLDGIDSALGSVGTTLGAIPAQLDSIETAIGSIPSGGSGGGETGAPQRIYGPLKDSNGAIIADAEISVYPTRFCVASERIDTQRTDAFGNATFYLEDGTYHVVAVKSGVSFPGNPEAWEVSL